MKMSRQQDIDDQFEKIIQDSIEDYSQSITNVKSKGQLLVNNKNSE